MDLYQNKGKTEKRKYFQAERKRIDDRLKEIKMDVNMLDMEKMAKKKADEEEWKKNKALLEYYAKEEHVQIVDEDLKAQ